MAPAEQIAPGGLSALIASPVNPTWLLMEQGDAEADPPRQLRTELTRARRARLRERTPPRTTA